MKFTPKAKNNLAQLTDADIIKDKFRQLGDAGLVSRGRPCNYRQGVYYARLTGKCACLFVMTDQGPKVVRIGDKTVIYRIMVRKARLRFWENL